MYKVFINDKPLIITDSFQHKNYTGKVLELTYRNEASIEEAEALLLNSTYLLSVIIVCKNVNEVWAVFCKRYEVIEAAGGLVVSKNGELLLIFRNGKWDLPKGKIEKGESEELAALREVEEECGIKNIELGNKVTVVFHTYLIENRKILKKTHWYWMKWGGSEALKPQTDEGISEITTRDSKNLEDIFSNTYQSIAELVSIYATNFSRQ
jgi:ADP-ribose pyrophosphatase YjhB (NUDIX family)